MATDTGCGFCAQLRDAAGGGGAAGRRGRARIGNRRRLALDRHVRAPELAQPAQSDHVTDHSHLNAWRFAPSYLFFNIYIFCKW